MVSDCLSPSGTQRAGKHHKLSEVDNVDTPPAMPLLPGREADLQEQQANGQAQGQLNGQAYGQGLQPEGQLSGQGLRADGQGSPKRLRVTPQVGAYLLTHAS